LCQGLRLNAIVPSDYQRAQFPIIVLLFFPDLAPRFTQIATIVNPEKLDG